MSVKVMGAVWELNLPTNEKLVLLAYADHADHDGNHVFPSFELIAQKCCISERQVQAIVAKLVKKRYMVRKNSDKGGRGVRAEWSIRIAGKAAETTKDTAPFTTPETTKDTAPFTTPETTKDTAPFTNGKRVKPGAERVKCSAEKGEAWRNSHYRDARAEPSLTIIEPSSSPVADDEEDESSLIFSPEYSANVAGSYRDIPRGMNAAEPSSETPENTAPPADLSLLDLSDAAAEELLPGKLIRQFRREFGDRLSPTGKSYVELLREQTKANSPTIRSEIGVQRNLILTMWMPELRDMRVNPTLRPQTTGARAPSTVYAEFVGD